MWRWVVALIAGVLVIPLTSATAAQNTVTALPRLGGFEQPILPNDLKPPECFDIYVTNLVIDGNGGRANDLVLGGPFGGNLSGRQGDDCIVAGGGLSHLRGQAGNDVLVAGPGTWLLHGGPGNDRCYLKGGFPLVNGCETVVP
ncbi:MAG: hypothetical protein Kow0010_14600 [Dehalococcoidia bacterium]